MTPPPLSLVILFLWSFKIDLPREHLVRYRSGELRILDLVDDSPTSSAQFFENLVLE